MNPAPLINRWIIRLDVYGAFLRARDVIFCMVLVSVRFDMAIANAGTQHPILEAEWIINVLGYKGGRDLQLSHGAEVVTT